MSTRIIMHTGSVQRGMALVSALLLLLVVTMLSVGMFHSFGLQEHLAGNTREKARATHAAEAGQTAAETWLVQNANTIAAGGNSGGTNCTAVTTTPQVCSNVLASVTQVPWSAGVKYQPSTLLVGSAGTTNNFADNPVYYISFLAQNYVPSSGTQIVAYQVDSSSYAGNTTTVSVVESTYLVSITYNARNDNNKFVYEGGP